MPSQFYLRFALQFPSTLPCWEYTPLGARQVIYLGPVIFLAAGIAIHWIADSLAALTHRMWLAPALAVVAASAIALVEWAP